MKKSKNTLIVVIAIVVALGAVVGIIVGKLSGKKPVSPSSDQQSSSVDGQDAADEQSAVPRAPLSDALKSAAVGDYVTFGSYEQDNDESNGKEGIEWLVLAREDDRMLVISRYGLDEHPYHSNDDNITWEACSLRSWLNNTFLNSAFSASEQERIVISDVTADINPKFDTPQGNDTQDKIFVLSTVEAETYFSSDKERECVPTAYAEAREVYAYQDSGICPWWLRSLSGDSWNAESVSDGGRIDSGTRVNYSHYAVRPALWIDLTS